MDKYMDIIHSSLESPSIYIQFKLYDLSDYNIYEKNGQKVIYTDKSDPFATYTITYFSVVFE